MRRSLALLTPLPLICGLTFQSPHALAQTKIEPQIDRELTTRDRVRVIIRTRPDPYQPAGGAAVSNAAGYLSGRLGAGVRNVKSIGKLAVVSAEIDTAALANLREDPNVAAVLRDIPVPPALFKSVQQIGADHYHKAGVRGTGFNVAVLDTGIEKDHPALGKSVVKEACFSTSKSEAFDVKSLCPRDLEVSLVPGAAGQCPKTMDRCDHGTHVAGIVAGHDMSVEDKRFGGVAPAAGVVAVQVFTLFQNDARHCGAENPTCILSFPSDQLRALEWLYRNRNELKIAAINMSLGGGYFESHCDLASPLTEIIELFRSKQIPTVVAAGNEKYFDGINEPACVSQAISVAAVDGNGELDISYSNVSPLVSIAAPGTDIVSAGFGGRYRKQKGTSMAAPHVAASFALMRQVNPRITVKQMMENLARVSVPITDIRTGTVVRRIDLTKLVGTSTVASAAAPVAASAASREPTVRALRSSPTSPQTTKKEPPPLVVSDSYVVRTRKPAAEIQSILNDQCPDHNCRLRQIGDDSYKLDISPKSSNAPVPDGAEVEKMLGGGVKVFDNRLSRPTK